MHGEDNGRSENLQLAVSCINIQVRVLASWGKSPIPLCILDRYDCFCSALFVRLAYIRMIDFRWELCYDYDAVRQIRQGIIEEPMFF